MNNPTTVNVLDTCFRLQAGLSRWARHDLDCPANGSYHCDDRCTCRLREFVLRMDAEVREIECEVAQMRRMEVKS